MVDLSLCFFVDFHSALTEQTKKKRLVVIVWSKDTKNNYSEFLGCLSFGLRHLATKEKVIKISKYLQLYILQYSEFTSQ